MGEDITAKLNGWCPNQYMQDHEFVNIFGQRLQLVPTIVTTSELKQVFGQIGQGNMQISNSDVRNFIMTQAPKSPIEMANDLLKATVERIPDVKNIFNNNTYYYQGQGMMEQSKFTDLLMNDLLIDQINAEFLAAVYSSNPQHHGAVDCH